MSEFSGKPTILLVEDNPLDEKLTLRALEQCPVAHHTVVARDGEEALIYLFGDENGRRPILPALVLLDLKLPKVGGLEILQRLRSNEQTRGIPVVVLTSSDVERDILQSYNIGVNSYIQKPVDYDQYTSTIQELGLYWLTINKNP
ncbi:MAG TPA: response regulator [Fimbriimonadaceae bacterium]|nr:response regulator [Fimbriimonadaceae bacterium]